MKLVINEGQYKNLLGQMNEFNNEPAINKKDISNFKNGKEPSRVGSDDAQGYENIMREPNQITYYDEGGNQIDFHPTYIHRKGKTDLEVVWDWENESKSEYVLYTIDSAEFDKERIVRKAPIECDGNGTGYIDCEGNNYFRVGDDIYFTSELQQYPYNTRNKQHDINRYRQ